VGGNVPCSRQAIWAPLHLKSNGFLGSGRKALPVNGCRKEGTCQHCQKIPGLSTLGPKKSVPSSFQGGRRRENSPYLNRASSAGRGETSWPAAGVERRDAVERSILRRLTLWGPPSDARKQPPSLDTTGSMRRSLPGPSSGVFFTEGNATR